MTSLPHAALAAAALLAWGTGVHAQDACDIDPSAPLLSACRPIIPTALHRTEPACPGRPDSFVPNQRLALIENGAVPCVHVETAEATTCAFLTRRQPTPAPSAPPSGRLAAASPLRPGGSALRPAAGHDSRGDDEDDDDHDAEGGHSDRDTCASGDARAYYSGNWLKASDGNRYALVGQAIALDGTRGGDYIIGARVASGTSLLPAGAILSVPATATVACIGASGRDAAGTMTGTSLLFSCTLETLNAETNGNCQPLRNVSTIPVCTSSNPHPDGAEMLSADPQANVYCYRGAGAGLNDINGQERDERGVYLTGDGQYNPCHFVVSGGVGVPAAKRPATRSLPFPGSVRVDTPLRWRVYSPYVTVANP